MGNTRNYVFVINNNGNVKVYGDLLDLMVANSEELTYVMDGNDEEEIQINSDTICWFESRVEAGDTMHTPDSLVRVFKREVL